MFPQLVIRVWLEADVNLLQGLVAGPSNRIRQVGDLLHRTVQFRSTKSVLSQALEEVVQTYRPGACRGPWIQMPHIHTRDFLSWKHDTTNEHSHVYIDDRWINQAPEKIHNEKTQDSSDSGKHEVRTWSAYLPRASNPGGSLPDICLLHIRVRRPETTQSDSGTPPIGLCRSLLLLVRSGARSSWDGWSR